MRIIQALLYLTLASIVYLIGYTDGDRFGTKSTLAYDPNCRHEEVKPGPSDEIICNGNDCKVK